MATRAFCPPERLPIFCLRSASENWNIARNLLTDFFVALKARLSGSALTAWETVSASSSSSSIWL